MKKLKNEVKGITMVVLVITIIVLLILSAVAISLVIGQNGLFSRSKQATNKYIKQEATEAMNMKISGIQIQSYTETQKLPNLQYLSDKLCEDEEIDYVLLASKKEASLDKIQVGEAKSIYTKIKKYPYEFEINSSLQLASIDNIKIENAQTDSTIASLQSTISALETKITSLENSYNNLISQVNSLNAENEKLGKLLYRGSFNSGSITVSGLENYSYIIAICDWGWAIPLYKANNNRMLGIGGRGGKTSTSNEVCIMGLTLTYNNNTLTYVEGKYGLLSNSTINTTNLTINRIYGIF